MSEQRHHQPRLKKWFINYFWYQYLYEFNSLLMVTAESAGSASSMWNRRAQTFVDPAAIGQVLPSRKLQADLYSPSSGMSTGIPNAVASMVTSKREKARPVDHWARPENIWLRLKVQRVAVQSCDSNQSASGWPGQARRFTRFCAATAATTANRRIALNIIFRSYEFTRRHNETDGLVSTTGLLYKKV